MTHFAVLVLTESGTHDEVAHLLAPYRENDKWFADGSRWDWWQIGGRFTGLLTGYDPDTDPANVETCGLCDGTGERPGGREQFGSDWYDWCHGCNNCMGKGTRVKWPTDWQAHDGDALPVGDLQLDEWRFIPGALVTPDGKWHERARAGWFGTRIDDEDGNPPKPEATWAAVVRAMLEQHPEATAVVVDCHV